MKDIGYSKSDDALMADIEKDGFGTLGDPAYTRSPWRPVARQGTPVVYLGDAVSWVSEHPTAPPLTLHGEVTRLGVDAVTVYCEETDALCDVPYAEVRRG